MLLSHPFGTRADEGRSKSSKRVCCLVAGRRASDTARSAVECTLVKKYTQGFLGILEAKASACREGVLWRVRELRMVPRYDEAVAEPLRTRCDSGRVRDGTVKDGPSMCRSVDVGRHRRVHRFPCRRRNTTRT